VPPISREPQPTNHTIVRHTTSLRWLFRVAFCQALLAAKSKAVKASKVDDVLSKLVAYCSDQVT